MKKLLFFNVLVLAATVSAVYCLTLLDKIVHGTLYDYGLQFSYDWANPYWMMLRIVEGFIGLAVVFTVVSVVYVYRKYIYSKPQVLQTGIEKSEKRVISSSVQEPEPLSEAQRVGGLVKCTHCNRVFAQPLRMLDFHSERPRIINICPFCNEVIPPILRHEEVEKGRKAFLRGKKNDSSKEMLLKEDVGESEEKVAASS